MESVDILSTFHFRWYGVVPFLIYLDNLTNTIMITFVSTITVAVITFVSTIINIQSRTRCQHVARQQCNRDWEGLARACPVFTRNISSGISEDNKVTILVKAFEWLLMRDERSKLSGWLVLSMFEFVLFRWVIPQMLTNCKSMGGECQQQQQQQK